MSLIKRWGLGVELVFDARDAVVNMTKTHKATARLGSEFRDVGTATDNFASKLGALGMVLAPLGVAFGLAMGKGSQLAADLEAQTLTMGILLKDAGKAELMIAGIREKAASTPFAEGDLIEGSKRLLGLTKGNVGATEDLLDLAMQITALNPGRSVVDAVEALLDAAGGGGFERIKELNIRGLSAAEFKDLGVAGGDAWSKGVLEAIQAKLTEVTGGADLVDALSGTFTGRLSTMKDAISNGFLEFGKVVNAEIGGLLGPVTERLKGLGPVIKTAAEDLAGSVRGMVARAQPWVDRILGWWDSLGTEGQAGILNMIMALGAFSAVVVPIGGAISAVVFAVSALVGAVTAAWPVITAVGGALLAALAPEILIPVALGLATVAAGFAILSREGEGPIDTMLRLGESIRVGLVGAFNAAAAAGSAFSAGFGETFGGLEGPINRVRLAFAPVVDKLAEMGALMGDRFGDVTFWHMLGQAVGMVGEFLVTKVAAGLELVAAVIDILVSAWRPMALALDLFVQGLLGVVTGSMDAKTAITLMISGVAGAILGLINIAFQFLAGAIELLLRTLVFQLSGIPGMEGLLEATGNLGAEGIASARAAFEGGISNAVAGIDLAENRSRQAKAAGSSPTIEVTPQVENTVQVETTVCVDGREIARAEGANKVRTGQRQGENIPAQARGRVLRGGVVRPLQPAEVW